jgi:predicted amidohydrolase
MTNSRYRAVALQFRCDAINAIADPTAARTRMLSSIGRLEAQIAATKAFIGDDLRLVVLPEYFLSGFPTGPDLPTWQARACLYHDGPEYQRLATIATQLKVYLSGNVYEVDPAFPEVFFQVSFILNDQGLAILKYRRLISMYTATPHDVWDRFLSVYGATALFPVANTPLGRLACVASEEILFPEVARAMVFGGAEVLLHSSSEVGSPDLTRKGVARRARAIENLAWVISANSAGIADAGIPAASTDGGSAIIDFEGHVKAQAGPGESMVATTTIDLDAQRHARTRIGMDNYLARLRTEPFALLYQQSIYPPNLFATGRPTRAAFHHAIAAGIERLQAKPQ